MKGSSTRRTATASASHPIRSMVPLGSIVSMPVSRAADWRDGTRTIEEAGVRIEATSGRCAGPYGPLKVTRIEAACRTFLTCPAFVAGRRRRLDRNIEKENDLIQSWET